MFYNWFFPVPNLVFQIQNYIKFHFQWYRTYLYLSFIQVDFVGNKCVYQGVRNVRFSENLACFVLRFALLPYYRRLIFDALMTRMFLIRKNLQPVLNCFRSIFPWQYSILLRSVTTVFFRRFSQFFSDALSWAFFRYIVFANAER